MTKSALLLFSVLLLLSPQRALSRCDPYRAVGVAKAHFQIKHGAYLTSRQAAIASFESLKLK